jgi:hypothetical protein
MKLRLLLLLILFVAPVCPTYGAESAKAIIPDFASKWQAAYNTGDARTLAELYASDAVFLSGVLGRIEGQEQNRERDRQADEAGATNYPQRDGRARERQRYVPLPMPPQRCRHNGAATTAIGSASLRQYRLSHSWRGDSSPEFRNQLVVERPRDCRDQEEVDKRTDADDSKSNEDDRGKSEWERNKKDQQHRNRAAGPSQVEPVGSESAEKEPEQICDAHGFLVCIVAHDRPRIGGRM